MKDRSRSCLCRHHRLDAARVCASRRSAARGRVWVHIGKTPSRAIPDTEPNATIYHHRRRCFAAVGGAWAYGRVVGAWWAPAWPFSGGALPASKVTLHYSTVHCITCYDSTLYGMP